MKVYLTDPHCATREYLERVATFIRYNSTPPEWTPAHLNECWLFEIATYAPGTQDAYEALGLPAPYMAAMAWVHRTPVPGEIEAHAVAAPQYHGKWMTRSVIRQLNYVVDHTGCTRMIAQITTP